MRQRRPSSFRSSETKWEASRQRGCPTFVTSHGATPVLGSEKPGFTPAERAYPEAENRLPDHKPTDEDKDEKELEKEEDESEAGEPGKYEPLSIVDKKSAPKPKKGRGSSKSTR